MKEKNEVTVEEDLEIFDDISPVLDQLKAQYTKDKSNSAYSNKFLIEFVNGMWGYGRYDSPN